MIIAFFILGLFALYLWIVWDDLSDLIAGQIEEIGAGEYRDEEDLPGLVPSAGLSATLTSESAAGAGTPFDWDAAA